MQKIRRSICFTQKGNSLQSFLCLSSLKRYCAMCITNFRIQWQFKEYCTLKYYSNFLKFCTKSQLTKLLYPVSGCKFEHPPPHFRSVVQLEIPKAASTNSETRHPAKHAQGFSSSQSFQLLLQLSASGNFQQSTLSHVRAPPMYHLPHTCSWPVVFVSRLRSWRPHEPLVELV
jgi:hypothetical protein